MIYFADLVVADVQFALKIWLIIWMLIVFSSFWVFVLKKI